MKYVRIQLDGNKAYLVYNRGAITEYALISDAAKRTRTNALEYAFSDLKELVRQTRMAMRDGDKLREKESGSILDLLKRKRRVFARDCLKAKKPVNWNKHVGVEIEFISTSSRDSIAETFALYGLQNYVELKHDGSVSGGDSGRDCDGSCREDCSCAECGETHYCEDQSDCDRRYRNYEGSGRNDNWEFRDDCRDCEETETRDDCDCGGKDDEGNDVCRGEHIVCQGHCTGHSCLGYEDHNDYDCECECNCNTDNGHEVAIVAKQCEIHNVVRKVCKALAEHDAEVNSTCGLHVHIDARRRKEDKMFSNLVNAQRVLYSMVPKSRFKNTYCAPNESGTDMDAYSGRYWGINPKSYSEHKTIEVRLHSGTVNAEKINNWIDLLQKIAYAKPISKIESLADLTAKVKLPINLVTYIKQRVEKFAKEHGSYSLPLGQPEVGTVLPLFKDIAADYDSEMSIAA